MPPRPIPPQPRGTTLIHAQFRLVTPAYLRGANQQSSEMRTASFKGVLRYWWRALHWASALQNHPTDQTRALAWLHHQEAVLSGAAAGGSHSGQGLVRQIRISCGPLGTKPVGTAHSLPDAYMLGQGLSRGAQTTASAIQTAAAIEVNLLVNRAGGDAKEVQGLVKALRLMGTLGGLGARSRRGCGSLALQALEVGGKAIELPQDAESLNAELVDLITCCAHVTELPRFTAISGWADFEVVSGPTLAELQANIGCALILYRSSGRSDDGGATRFVQLVQNGPQLKAKHIFQIDHHSIWNASRGIEPNQAPQRAAFGLPHNYRFSNGAIVEVNARLPGTTPNQNQPPSRRASPLFVHYHQFANGQHCAVVAYLPAQFLPTGATVEVKAGNTRTQLTPPTLDKTNDVVPNFLARL